MFNTPPLFHTAPDGRPADTIGKFPSHKQFACKVQAATAVILEPTIMASL